MFSNIYAVRILRPFLTAFDHQIVGKHYKDQIEVQVGCITLFDLTLIQINKSR